MFKKDTSYLFYSLFVPHPYNGNAAAGKVAKFLMFCVCTGAAIKFLINFQEKR